MYRKVPVDLLEGTRRGSVLSTLAVLTMALLFFLETKAFLSSTLQTNLRLDSNPESQLRVNFNITMLDLACDYATIDVVSVLGTQQNVTQHVTRIPLDGDGSAGHRQGQAARLKQAATVAMFDATIGETLEELHEDGVDAVDLDADLLAEALEENTYVFVDFFASWCSHCRDLAPTWETLAEVMYEAAENKVEKHEHHVNHGYSDDEYQAAVGVELPVLIGKVDCVQHDALCNTHNIRAYPNLKFFVDGKVKGDYQGHRTVVEMAHFIEQMEKEHKGHAPDAVVKSSHAKHVAAERTIQTDEHQATADEHSGARHRMQHSWDAGGSHPGCRMSGFLLVDRAPGNFHVQARSRSHDLDPLRTNVSHVIHHLSFGRPMSSYFLEHGLQHVPGEFLASTRPFDGNAYVTTKEHEAHHHYLKVVTTEFNADKATQNRYDQRKKKYYKPSGQTLAYQILQSSQMSAFERDVVPEAKFTYDLSPIAVSYERKWRKWYDYLTSVMAIVGGTFTVVGMLESGIHSATSKKNR